MKMTLRQDIEFRLRYLAQKSCHGWTSILGALDGQNVMSGSPVYPNAIYERPLRKCHGSVVNGSSAP